MSARKVFQDSIIPLPAEPGVTHGGLIVNAMTTDHPDEMMEVHFSLSIAEDLQSKVEKRVANGEVVPPDELAELYSATSSQRDALTDWLKAQGYEILQSSRDGIYARAKASQIAGSLEVNMVPVTKNGITYTAAQNAPSLPEEVADGVRSINGLQPFRQANKHFVRLQYADETRMGSVPGGPATNIGNAPPYLVPEIAKAYGADGLGLDGAGQTIAILIDTFPDDADLTAFWAKNRLPITLAQITKINVAGGALPAPTGEETLDASWTSGIAPKAQIRIYASGALTFVALDKAIDRIISDLAGQPGMRQLSISLGLGESFMSPAEVKSEHTKFLYLAASGVNVFVSSGDAGSNPDNTGHSPTGPLQAEYEASDPTVVGVGGTTLRLNAGGVITSESGWSASGGAQADSFHVQVGRPDRVCRLVPSDSYPTSVPQQTPTPELSSSSKDERSGSVARVGVRQSGLASAPL